MHWQYEEAWALLCYVLFCSVLCQQQPVINMSYLDVWWAKLISGKDIRVKLHANVFHISKQIKNSLVALTIDKNSIL